MKVTIHQPNYLPYLGFFDKAARADMLILLDTAQYSKNGMQNRNRIKTPQGEQWLTIPVLTKNNFGVMTKDVQIDNKKDWRQQNLRSIILNYKKARYFSEFEEFVTGIYSREREKLSDFCTEIIEYIMKLLPTEVKVIRSSELEIKGTRSEMLLHLCKQVGATTYLSGKSGREYLDREIFEQNEMKLEFHGFNPPVYEQLWGEFIPNLSTLDYLMNCGKEKFSELMEQKK